jgi:hypothetical protein
MIYSVQNSLEAEKICGQLSIFSISSTKFLGLREHDLYPNIAAVNCACIASAQRIAGLMSSVLSLVDPGHRKPWKPPCLKFILPAQVAEIASKSCAWSWACRPARKPRATSDAASLKKGQDTKRSTRARLLFSVMIITVLRVHERAPSCLPLKKTKVKVLSGVRSE